MSEQTELDAARGGARYWCTRELERLRDEMIRAIKRVPKSIGYEDQPGFLAAEAAIDRYIDACVARATPSPGLDADVLAAMIRNTVCYYPTEADDADCAERFADDDDRSRWCIACKNDAALDAMGASHAVATPSPDAPSDPVPCPECGGVRADVAESSDGGMEINVCGVCRGAGTVPRIVAEVRSDPEVMASIRRGIEDVKAGRVIPLSELNRKLTPSPDAGVVGERDGLRNALDALDIDNHYWQKRPCETCRNVSTILARPFGCVRKLAAYAATGEEGRA